MFAKPALLTAVLIASVVLAGCAGSSSSGGAGQSSGPASTQGVDMKDIQFKPLTLTVAKGTKVTWTNRDSTLHTVTSDDSGGPLQSGNIAAGGKYQYTFASAGTFKYHCVPHASKGADGNYAGMVGTIVVTE